jgi:2-succinyl-5-enolpyruvyl-6-hydroxy-3-cyclohexene-1-carboxylate synthase
MECGFKFEECRYCHNETYFKIVQVGIQKEYRISAKKNEIPPELLKEIAKSSCSCMKIAVAAWKHTPSSVLEILSLESDNRVLEKLVRNPASNVIIRNLLALRPEVRVKFLLNPKATVQELNEVILMCAGDKEAKREILNILKRNQRLRTRMIERGNVMASVWLAEQKNLSTSEMETLSRRQIEEVSLTLVENQYITLTPLAQKHISAAISCEILQKLAKRKELTSEIKTILLFSGVE